MLRTENYHAVTPIGRHHAVTHHHGSHSHYVVADTLKLFPLESPDGQAFLEATVILVGFPDFMIVQSETQLCPVDFKISAPRSGTEYVQIGLSGRVHSVMHRRGYISNDSVMNNNGFYLGSAGCAKGDSGGGVFAVDSRTLYGICCATFKAMGKTDFKKVQMDDIGNNLNLLSSHAAEPVLSCISPSTNFAEITGESPYFAEDS